MSQYLLNEALFVKLEAVLKKPYAENQNGNSIIIVGLSDQYFIPRNYKTSLRWLAGGQGNVKRSTSGLRKEEIYGGMFVKWARIEYFLSHPSGFNSLYL